MNKEKGKLSKAKKKKKKTPAEIRESVAHDLDKGAVWGNDEGMELLKHIEIK